MKRKKRFSTDVADETQMKKRAAEGKKQLL
jgi:hypothetical protein